MSDAELLAAFGIGPLHALIIGASLGFIVYFIISWGNDGKHDDPDKQQ